MVNWCLRSGSVGPCRSERPKVVKVAKHAVLRRLGRRNRRQGARLHGPTEFLLGSRSENGNCNRSVSGGRHTRGRHWNDAVPRETATLRLFRPAYRCAHPPGPEGLLAIQRLAPPRAVLPLKKSAFVLMTDPMIPVFCSLMPRNLSNKYSSVYDFSSKSKKLVPGIHFRHGDGLEGDARNKSGHDEGGSRA